MSEADETDANLLFEEHQDAIEWPVPRLFLQYGRQYKALLVLAMLASMIAPLVSLIPTYVLQTAIDAVLLDNEPFALPGVPGAWLPNDRLSQLYVVVGVIVGTAALSSGLSWLSQATWGKFALRLQHVIRTDSYEKIQRLGVDFFDNQQTGQIMSILNSDIISLDRLLKQFLANLLRIVVQFFGIAAVLFIMHWQLALFALLVLPVMSLLSRYFVKEIKPKYQRVRQRIGALNARIENNVAGIRVIKAFTTEDYEANRVRDASDAVYDRSWEALSTRIRFFPAMNFVNWVGFAIVLVVGGIWIVVGPPWVFTMPLTVGTLVAFLVYTQQFQSPIMQAGHLLDNYFNARAAVVRVFALQDYEIEVDSDPDATVLDRVEGRMSAEHVSFAYDEDEGPVLRDVTFDVEPGSFVGIVGPTGAGKTTLTKLLVRFYDPDEGTVRLDGHDLRDLHLRSLRSAIAVVSQEPYLFSGSVRENIAYGRPDLSEDAVIRAARMAHAHEFVSDLDDGYDTQVGQRGVKLSGGQRQRIALARAIVGDPEIFILDEATSHVDNETEVLIQHSLAQIIEDRTTFAVAHRLSTIRRADVILVFDEGELVERGTHEELLEVDGLYANLWRVQVGAVDEIPESFLERHTRT